MNSNHFTLATVLCTTLFWGATTQAERPKRITAVETSSLGTTVWLRPQHSPFPAPPLPYKNRTVVVFVPKQFKATDKVDLVVYFHGHRSTARDSLTSKKLREQLVRSGRNAILMVPQLAYNASESRPGKLERRGGFKRLVDEVLKLLGASPILLRPNVRPGRVALAAHSGGFQAAAMCIKRGQVTIHEVYLFDAMYGFPRIFAPWIASGNRFLSWYGSKTPRILKWTERVKKKLTYLKVPYSEVVEDAATTQWLRSHSVGFITTEVEHKEVPFARKAFQRALATSGFQVVYSQ